MKRVVLGTSIALSTAFLAGCGTHAGVATNGGVPPAMLGKTGVLSADMKAQTGSITYVNLSADIAARKARSRGVGQ